MDFARTATSMRTRLFATTVRSEKTKKVLIAMNARKVMFLQMATARLAKSTDAPTAPKIWNNAMHAFRVKSLILNMDGAYLVRKRI